MIRLLSTLTFFILSLIGTSCLPLAKVTQCQENEGFDPASKRCLPLIGAATTSSVHIKSKTPITSYALQLGDAGVTHSISVSDPYGFGYSTKWVITYISDNTFHPDTPLSTVASNTQVFSFVPDARGSNRTGVYTLEAQLFDESGANLLDSVSWTINVHGDELPYFENQNPVNLSATYFVNDVVQTLSASVVNSDGRSLTVNTYTNSTFTGSTSSALTNFPVSVNIDPSVLGVGIHSVEFVLFDDANPGVILDRATWWVNILPPDYPYLVESPNGPNFSETIYVIDGQPMTATPASGFRRNDFTPMSQFCLALATRPGGITNADVDLYINGAPMGSSAISTTVEACYSALGPITTSLPLPYLTQATAILRVAGSTEEIERRTWPVLIMPANSKPEIIIDYEHTKYRAAGSLVDTDLCSPDGTSGSTVYVAKNCNVTQSVNSVDGTDYSALDDVNNQIKIAIAVKDIDTDFSSADPFEFFYEVRPVSSFDERLDGAVTRNYSKTTCTVLADSAIQATSTVPIGGWQMVYICTLNLDAHSSGVSPIAPNPSGQYVITGYVEDRNTAFPGSIPRRSNEVEWHFNVTEHISDPQIVAQYVGAGASSDFSETRVQSLATCSMSGAQVYSGSGNSITEGLENLAIKIRVRDLERDNLSFEFDFENQTFSTPYPFSQGISLTTLPTNYDASGYTDLIVCIAVPEWVVSTVGSADSQIRVRVYDYNDTFSISSIVETGTGLTNDFSISVNNYNPAPTFIDNTTVDLAANTLSISPQVFAGISFNLPSTGFSDASSADGKNINWQWQICFDDTLLGTTSCGGAGTWNNIAGADSTNISFSSDLNWTPSYHQISATQQYAHFRLCLGDDGPGNNPDCTIAASTKYYYGAEIHHNSVSVESIDVAGYLTASDVIDHNNVASWYDSSDDTLYKTYSGAFLGTDYIYVEKYQQSSASLSWERVHAIKFQADQDPLIAPNAQVSNLSMDGIEGDVIILAYSIYDSSDNSIKARIRKINIENDKLNFDYDVGTRDPLGGNGNDLFDDASSCTNFPPDCAIAATGPQNERITISSYGDSDNIIDITLVANDGTNQTFTHNCAPDCTTQGNPVISTSLSNLIQADPLFSQEFHTDVTGAGELQITGAAAEQYHDSPRSIIALGDIKIVGTDWYLPYITVTHIAGTPSQILQHIRGNNVGDFTASLTSTVATGTALSQSIHLTAGAGLYNQELSNINVADTHMVYTYKKSNGNAELRKINYFGPPTVETCDVFNEASEFSVYSNVKNLKLDKASLSNDIFIAGISVDTLGNEYLNTAIHDFSSFCTNRTATMRYVGTHLVTEPTQINDLDITVTHNAITGVDSAFIAYNTLPTASVVNAANKTFIAKISGSSTLAPQLVDYQMLGATDIPAGPYLNRYDNVANSALHFSETFDMVAANYGHEAFVFGSPTHTLMPLSTNRTGVFLSTFEDNPAPSSMVLSNLQLINLSLESTSMNSYVPGTNFGVEGTSPAINANP